MDATRGPPTLQRIDETAIQQLQRSSAYFSIFPQNDGQVYVHLKQFITDECTGNCQVNPSGIVLSMHDYAGFILMAKGIENSLQFNGATSGLTAGQIDEYLAEPLQTKPKKAKK